MWLQTEKGLDLLLVGAVIATGRNSQPPSSTGAATLLPLLLPWQQCHLPLLA